MSSPERTVLLATVEDSDEDVATVVPRNYDQMVLPVNLNTVEYEFLPWAMQEITKSERQIPGRATPAYVKSPFSDSRPTVGKRIVGVYLAATAYHHRDLAIEARLALSTIYTESLFDVLISGLDEAMYYEFSTGNKEQFGALAAAAIELVKAKQSSEVGKVAIASATAPETVSAYAS